MKKKQAGSHSCVPHDHVVQGPQRQTCPRQKKKKKNDKAVSYMAASWNKEIRESWVALKWRKARCRTKKRREEVSGGHKYHWPCHKILATKPEITLYIRVCCVLFTACAACNNHAVFTWRKLVFSQKLRWEDEWRGKKRGPERIVGSEEEYRERMSPFWEDGGQPEPGCKKKILFAVPWYSIHTK